MSNTLSIMFMFELIMAVAGFGDPIVVVGSLALAVVHTHHRGRCHSSALHEAGSPSPSILVYTNYDWARVTNMSLIRMRWQGLSYIGSIFRGSKQAAIIKAGDHTMSEFGAGKSMPAVRPPGAATCHSCHAQINF